MKVLFIYKKLNFKKYKLSIYIKFNLFYNYIIYEISIKLKYKKYKSKVN